MMEWLDGLSAHELPSNPIALEQFRESYTDLLLALHENQSQQGFELAEEQYDPSLVKAFESWMAPVLRYVQSSCSPFSPRLKDAYISMWENKEEILSPINTRSSLVHDDCHVGTCSLTPGRLRSQLFLIHVMLVISIENLIFSIFMMCGLI